MKRALNKTLYIIAYGFWYLVALLPFQCCIYSPMAFIY